MWYSTEKQAGKAANRDRLYRSRSPSCTRSSVYFILVWANGGACEEERENKNVSTTCPVYSRVCIAALGYYLQESCFFLFVFFNVLHLHASQGCLQDERISDATGKGMMIFWLYSSLSGGDTQVVTWSLLHLLLVKCCGCQHMDVSKLSDSPGELKSCLGDIIPYWRWGKASAQLCIFFLIIWCLLSCIIQRLRIIFIESQSIEFFDQYLLKVCFVLQKHSTQKCSYF